MGDKVTINNIPTMTVRDYKKGQSLQYEVPEQTPVELAIDKGSYFGVSVNDVDEYQSNINLMNTFTDDGSQQLQIKVDTNLLGSVYADVHASNKGATAGVKSGGYNLGAVGSPLTVTATDVISVLTRAGAVLDEQNVPHTERFIVVPPWFRYLIMNSNVNNAQLMGDDKSILRNGRVGVIKPLILH
jgi:hypothetical protein